MAETSLDPISGFAAEKQFKWLEFAIFGADMSADQWLDPFNAVGDSMEAVPDGWSAGGYIDTDGVTQARAITSDDTEAMQASDPTRSDVSKDVHTAKFMFLDHTKLALALYHNMLLEDMPEYGTKWRFDSNSIQPNRRLMMLGHDPVADVYCSWAMSKCKVTDLDDKKQTRVDVDGAGYELTAYRDGQTKSLVTILGGPGWIALGNTGSTEVATGGQ